MAELRFNKEEQEMFEQAVQASSKILLYTMKELRIPNFIETEFKHEGQSYKLKIQKL